MKNVTLIAALIYSGTNVSMVDAHRAAVDLIHMADEDPDAEFTIRADTYDRDDRRQEREDKCYEAQEAARESRGD